MDNESATPSTSSAPQMQSGTSNNHIEGHSYVPLTREQRRLNYEALAWLFSDNDDDDAETAPRPCPAVHQCFELFDTFDKSTHRTCCRDDPNYAAHFDSLDLEGKFAYVRELLSKEREIGNEKLKAWQGDMREKHEAKWEQAVEEWCEAHDRGTWLSKEHFYLIQLDGEK